MTRYFITLQGTDADVPALAAWLSDSVPGGELAGVTRNAAAGTTVAYVDCPEPVDHAAMLALPDGETVTSVERAR